MGYLRGARPVFLTSLSFFEAVMRISALLALLPLAAHAAEPAPGPADATVVHRLDAVELQAVPVGTDGSWRPLLDPALVDDAGDGTLLETLGGLAPLDATHIEPWVLGPDGPVRLEDLLPEPVPLPEKYPELATGAPMPISAPIDHPGRADGDLSGRAVYLSQCHGYIYYTSLGRFSTQRGNLFDTVEDFHNPEGLNQFLTVYLENAGASVFTAKERDHNDLSVIVDDGDAGYSESGDSFADGQAGWGRQEIYRFGDNPFRSGGTRTMGSDSGDIATWTVTMPESGRYALYVSWDSAPGNASDAHYRITHAGGVIDRTFDQRVHGSTWQYVETLWFYADDPVTVELIGDSSESGKDLSIDAVRVGGGRGNIERYGDTTSVPRWQEGANLYTQFNGAPTSVYDAFSDGINGNDVAARSRWADWEHPQGEDAVYLSWHSNASAEGQARGTVTLVYEGNSGSATPGSWDLAWAVQEEMVDAIQMSWEPGWFDRGVRSQAVGEANPRHNDEMPSILVELAFHDNATDVAYLKHPGFRRDASRAMYRGIVRYFAERDGRTPHYLPEPPVGLAATHDDDGEIVLSWQPGPTGAPYGDAATGYLVQTSPDGKAWSEGFAVTGTRTVLDMEPGTHLFARVVATNEGGLSFASEVVGALRSPDTEPAVLVVGAFDRFEASQLEWDTASFRVGEVRRMRTSRVNHGDIVAPHGLAVAEAGWPFDAITDEALDQVDLSDYEVVIWAAGEESTNDETVSAEQQQALRAYWEGEGALWVSGAEVLWDLDERGSASDKAFAAEVLGATMAADDAETYDASGVGLLEGLDLAFSPDAAPYPVEWADVIASDREVIATYATGGTAAVLGERVALFGVPFEAIHGGAGRERDLRGEVALRVLEALAPGYEPPEGVVDPEDPEDPGNDPLVDDPRVRIGEPRACGCSGLGSGGAPLGGLALVGLLLWRRRRA